MRIGLAAAGLDAEVANAGVAGNTTTQALARLDADVLARRPAIALVQFGINDSAIDVHRGRTEPRVPPSLYELNVRTLVRRLRAAGVAPILITPNPGIWTPRLLETYGQAPYNTTDKWGFNLYNVHYAASVRAIAAEMDVPLIDAYRMYEAQDRTPGGVEGWLPDGLHPSDEASQALANVAVRRVQELLREPIGVPSTSLIAFGTPLRVDAPGWHASSEGLTGTGPGNRATARVSLVEGDFRVRATLRAGPGGLFVFDGNTFAMEGEHHTVPAQGDPWVRFEAKRTDGILRVSIDGRPVAEVESPGAIAEFGLDPGRSEMTVLWFEVQGATTPRKVRSLPAAPEIAHQTLFERGMDGVFEYRIPALALTAGGLLVAVADARVDRAGDLSNNIDIAMRRSFDGGATWTAVERIVDHPGTEGAGDSQLTLDRDTKTLWIAYTYGSRGVGWQSSRAGFNASDTLQIVLRKSDDDGATWSGPINVTTQVKKRAWTAMWTAPGNGLQLASGRLLFPVSVADEDGHVQSRALLSDDHGRTWRCSGAIAYGTNESQLYERADGTVVANLRSEHGLYRRALARSLDGGATWGNFEHDARLTDAVCQASVLSLGQEGLLAFANPASTRRENLSIRLSDDEGVHWGLPQTVHRGPSAYSCMALLPDGSIGLLYEAGEGDPYETIRFAKVKVAGIGDRGSGNGKRETGNGKRETGNGKRTILRPFTLTGRLKPAPCSLLPATFTPSPCFGSRSSPGLRTRCR